MCQSIGLFAYDTSMLVLCKNMKGALHDAQISLATADEWLKSNGLHLNCIKSQTVVLTIKQLQENERRLTMFSGFAPIK